jgi:hypothetical protein
MMFGIPLLFGFEAKDVHSLGSPAVKAQQTSAFPGRAVEGRLHNALAR